MAVLLVGGASGPPSLDAVRGDVEPARPARFHAFFTGWPGLIGGPGAAWRWWP